MKILLTGLMIILISCQSTSTKQKTDVSNHSDSTKSDSALKISSISPLTAEFKNKSKSDSMT